MASTLTPLAWYSFASSAMLGFRCTTNGLQAGRSVAGLQWEFAVAGGTELMLPAVCGVTNEDEVANKHRL